MSLEHWFRLSSYLTLGLSCGALVFAETPFLPDLCLCLAPVLALLLAAWWIEGRWRLPNWGANVLGLLIAAGGAAWLVGQLNNEDSLLVRIPLHLALLPYMGPLIMAALLVKVFGTRDAGDFWRLQGLGLTQIVLGCILDGGPVFGALFAAYLASALTCLALHYRLVAGRRAAGAAGTMLARRLFAFTLRWTLLIAVPSLLLFLLTPRRDTSAWEPLSGLRPDTRRNPLLGGSEEINLNNTGRIEVNDEVALQVSAVAADDRPKQDLPVDQRWRGTILDQYEKGKWRTLHPMLANGLPGQRQLPDFGPQSIFLTFTVPPRQTGVLVLAEPIRLGSGSHRLPVVTLTDTNRPRLFYEKTGTVLPMQITTRREYRYRQVIPGSDAVSAPRAELVQPGTYLQTLTLFPSQLRAPLTTWTVELLRRLDRQPRYRLSPSARVALAEPHESIVVPADDWEALARVLTDYLAGSGEFTYTLDIRRQDHSLDPVLDFLCNVKQGHCERYATALALMLRSLGIPARVVKGFRGCDNLGDGQYVIRHRHAHAWVEMLRPHGVSPQLEYEWLELDPTPPESSATSPRLPWAQFWEDVKLLGLNGWQRLIIDYNADEQADLWQALKSGRHLTTLAKVLLIVPAALLCFATGWLLRRRLRQRRKKAVRTDAAPAFYRRLAAVLACHASLRPRSGQTPREYGEAARAYLQGRPEWTALAELPLRVVDLFYRVRFGGQPLSDSEQHTVDAELDHFTEALRQGNASG